MDSYFLFLALGLGAGAAAAAIGVGVVLTYRASGVVNFSAGAMALLPAYWYDELRTTGDLILPIGHISFGTELPALGAAVITLVMSALLGLVIFALVLWPLRNAPTLAKVVATIGVMLLLQALVELRFGSGLRAPEAILPTEPISLLGVAVPRDRLELAGLVVLTGVVLWLVYEKTHFGIATRAAAENDRGARLLGYSPNVLAAGNWMIASVLAGATGILFSPIASLNPSTLVLLVVPGLAAALVGRLTSIGMTVTAGLILGMIQSETLKLQSEWSWLPQVGLQESLPFIVVILVLVVSGKRLPDRGTVADPRLPAVLLPRTPMLGAGIALLVGIPALFLLTGEYRLGLISSLTAGVLGLSVVVVTGYLGQISLAQMTFAGIAGFSLSKMSVQAGIPFPWAPILAALIAAAFGLVLGLPALRVRGVNLAVVTLGAAVAVSAVIFQNPKYSGGFDGATVPAPHIGGLDLGISGTETGDFPRPIFGVFVLVVLVILGLAVANLRRSGTGRRFLAVRANERAASSVGINVGATKLLGFGISAFIAGLGGDLLGYQQGNLSFDAFGVFVSVALLAFVYLGGIGTISGAVIAGLLVSNGLITVALDNWIGFGHYVVLIGSIALIVTAIANPDGIAGSAPRQLAQLQRSLSTRRLRGSPGTVTAERGAL